MGDPARRLEPPGTADLVLKTGGVAVFSIRGYVNTALADDMLRRATRLLDEQPQIRGFVFDCDALESYTPGAPFRGVAWIRQNADRIVATAVVARLGSISAVVRAAALLVPSVQMLLAENRAEGIAMVARAIGGRPRVSTGPRLRVPGE